MPAVHDATTEFTLTLTEEERSQLLNWLEQRLRTTLIEEHRTDSNEYKEYVVHLEDILNQVIAKLRR